MNLQRSLSLQDMPKVATIGLLLLTLLVGSHVASGRVSQQRERERTIRHMNLDMGRGPGADTSEVPENQPGAGDPNFVW